MSWSHAHLGIAADADERAIKRAYAAKLKTTRPDEDPVGFQTLHEAYHAALSWARHRSEDLDAGIEEDDGHAASVFPDSESESEPVESWMEDGRVDPIRMRPEPVMPAYAPLPLPRPATSTTKDDDAERKWLLHTCIEIASKESASLLKEWLSMQPALWSFDRKSAIGEELRDILEDTLPPISHENFDALADFFGYNDLQSGHDALEIRQLRTQLHESHRYEELNSAYAKPVSLRYNGQALQGFDHTLDFGPPASSTEAQSGPSTAEDTSGDGDNQQAKPLAAETRRQAFFAQAAANHRHLLAASNPLRDWLLAMIPGYPTSAAKFLRSWHAYLDGLPDDIDRSRVRFWHALADRSGVSAYRCLLVFVRCLLLGALAAVTQPLWTTLHELQDYREPREFTAAATATVSFLFWTYVATVQWLALRQFQSNPSDASRRFNALAVPALVACALLITALTDADYLAFAISIAGVSASIARQRARAGEFPFPFAWMSSMVDSSKSFPVFTFFIGAPLLIFFVIFTLMSATFTTSLACAIAAWIWIFGRNITPATA